MSWMDQIGDLVGKYTGGSGGNAEEDFDTVSRSAPADVLMGGIASALRSNDTPNIGSVVSQVFQNSSGSQKAGILNAILSALGPGLLNQLIGNPSLGSIAGLLSAGRVTEEGAEQVPADQAGELAEQAQDQGADIIGNLSGYLTSNPDLVKSLGGGALGAVLSRLK